MPHAGYRTAVRAGSTPTGILRKRRQPFAAVGDGAATEETLALAALLFMSPRQVLDTAGDSRRARRAAARRPRPLVQDIRALGPLLDVGPTHIRISNPALRPAFQSALARYRQAIDPVARIRTDLSEGRMGMRQAALAENGGAFLSMIHGLERAREVASSVPGGRCRTAARRDGAGCRQCHEVGPARARRHPGRAHPRPATPSAARCRPVALRLPACDLPICQGDLRGSAGRRGRPGPGLPHIGAGTRRCRGRGRAPASCDARRLSAPGPVGRSR